MSSHVCRRHKRARKAARNLAEKKVQLDMNPQFMKRERVVKGSGVVQHGTLWPKMVIPGASRREDLERRMAEVAAQRAVAPPLVRRAPRRAPKPVLAATPRVQTIASPPTTRQVTKGHSKSSTPKAAVKSQGSKGPEVIKTAPGGHAGGSRKAKGPKVDPSVDGS